MPKFVLALDPGITTGWAFGDIEDGLLNFVCGQGRWNVRECYEFLVIRKPDIIIYETFEFRNAVKTGTELFPREIIGIIKLYGLYHEDVSLYPQNPGNVMGYFTNVRLKNEGCYYPNSEHPRDATRHLLHWWKFGPGYAYAPSDGEPKYAMVGTDVIPR